MDQTKKLMLFVVWLISIMNTASSACINSFTKTSIVPLTLLKNDKGAVCLDGSPPSYYHEVGEDSGKNNWVVYLEGGGWCASADECKYRTLSKYGSSKYVANSTKLGHILSKSSKFNPDFCDWNKVYINYCDGSSFTGDVEAIDPATNLTYRGGRIFNLIMEDLISKGMGNAQNAILSGSSAGGVATIIHCDRFHSLFPPKARIKCLCDSGYFIQGKSLTRTQSFNSIFEGLITLQLVSMMTSKHQVQYIEN